MNNEGQDNKDESVIVSFFSRIFRGKKKKVVVTKKKKKKEFVAISQPSNLTDEKDSLIIDEPDFVDSNDVVVTKKKTNVEKANQQKSKVDASVEPLEEDKPLVDNTTIAVESDIKISDSFSDKEEEERKENIDDVNFQRSLLQYFEEFLKEKRYQINMLTTEYEECKKESEEVLVYDKALETSEEIERLLARIEQIKAELDRVKKFVEIDNSYGIDDDYIRHLLDEYRKKFSKDIDVNSFSINDEDGDYKPIIEQIDFIDQITLELANEVKIKVSDLKEREKDFEDFKDKLAENDDAFDSVKFMIKEHEFMLKDLEDKVNNSKHVIERVQHIHRTVNRHLGVLLLGYLAVRKNPAVPKTVKALVATQLVVGAVQNFIGRTQTETRVQRQIVVDDYEKEIIDGLKSIDNVFELIDDTMVKVVDLRKDFEEKFKDYDVPEYKEALDKLDELSKNIEERREYLSYTKKEFSDELDKNNIKVKELKYDSYDEEENRVEDIN